jgi:hypothetical protein
MSSENRIVLNTNKIFTGIQELDLTILLNTKSLEDIINAYNLSKYFRNILNKQSTWQALKQYFGIFKLNNFQELVILKQELRKSKRNYKNYYGSAIYDFKCGDRVIMECEPENYVVVKVEYGRYTALPLGSLIGRPVSNITLQQVDILGNPLSDNLIVGSVREGSGGVDPDSGMSFVESHYIAQHKIRVMHFGINDNEGISIQNVNTFVSSRQ